MVFALGALGVLFAGLGTLAFALKAIWRVAAELRRVDRSGRTMFRWRLVDLLSLLFLLQLPAALIAPGASRFDPRQGVALFVLASLLVVMLWLASVARLTRAGVDGPGRRVIFLAFVVPTLATSLAFLPFVTLLLTADVISGLVLQPLELGSIVVAITLVAALMAMPWFVRVVILRKSQTTSGHRALGGRPFPRA